MTALDYSTPAIGAASRTFAALVRLGESVGLLIRSVKNRRQIDYLSRMSAHELADIGLTRTDLEVASSSAFGTDPTARLSRFARDRYTVEDNARRVC